MDQPKIPTLKDTQKPQVKVRGMNAGLTLFDRLKSFRKKDLAFILAGLGTLFMAPLAEHFMMAPEGADSTLQPGLGGKGSGNGGGIFNGSGSSPYEPGTTGLAPGGAIGGGSDIITPLNVRDPSALVMGPGATQQPPTNSVAPAPPPPTAPSTLSGSDLKDALAASARGVGAAAGAVKKVLQPVPKVALGGSGLRGLGVSAGGSSASASLGGVSSAGLTTNKASSGGGLSHVTAAPGYKGTAARGPASGSGKGIEALKGAADAAGNRMNEGSAGGALNDAANTAIPNGGGSFGGNGQGGVTANDKAGTADNDKSSKNVGESLAFMKAKMEMEKDLELKYKEKEANDWNLQGAQWRNKLIENGIVGPLGDAIGGYIKKSFGPGSAKGSLGCFNDDASATNPNGTWFDNVDAGDVGTGYNDCDGHKFYTAGGTDAQGRITLRPCSTSGGSAATSSASGIGTLHCFASSDYGGGTGGANSGGGTTNGPQSTDRSGRPQVNVPSGAQLGQLTAICARIEKAAVDDKGKPVAWAAGSQAPGWLAGLHSEARTLIVVRDTIYKGKPGSDCTKPMPGAPATNLSAGDPDFGAKDSVVNLLKNSITKTRGADDESGSAIAAMRKAASDKPSDAVPSPVPGADKLTAAEKDNADARAVIDQLKKAVDPSNTWAHNGALPAEFTQDPTANAKATALKTDMTNLLSQVSASVGQTDKLSGNLATQQQQLDYVVKGGNSGGDSGAANGSGRPTLPDVIQNKIDMAAAVKKAKADDIPDQSQGLAANTAAQTDYGVMTMVIDRANKALKTDATKVPVDGTDVQIPKAFTPALTEYETKYKDSLATGDGADAMTPNKVKAKLVGLLKDTQQQSQDMVTTQVTWLDNIKAATPATSQLPSN